MMILRQERMRKILKKKDKSLKGTDDPLTGEKEVQKDIMIFLTGEKEKGAKGYNDSLTGVKEKGSKDILIH